MTNITNLVSRADSKLMELGITIGRHLDFDTKFLRFVGFNFNPPFEQCSKDIPISSLP